MEQPVICVIVPVYKAEATLPRCIESVLTQQLPGGLRLILVDDQSPDRSGEICDAYAAKDPRVVVLHRRERGVSGARNAGLRAATGEYIVFWTVTMPCAPALWPPPLRHRPLPPTLLCSGTTPCSRTIPPL